MQGILFIYASYLISIRPVMKQLSQVVFIDHMIQSVHRLTMTHTDLYCTRLSKLVSACFHLSFELLHEPALHTDLPSTNHLGRRSLPDSHLRQLNKYLKQRQGNEVLYSFNPLYLNSTYKGFIGFRQKLIGWIYCCYI